MNGKPSLEECRQAFSRIVDLLDGELYDFHDEVREASDIAAGFYRDLEPTTPERLPTEAELRAASAPIESPSAEAIAARQRQVSETTAHRGTRLGGR